MNVSRRGVLTLLGALGGAAVAGTMLLRQSPHPLVAGRSRLSAAIALGDEWLGAREVVPTPHELLAMVLGQGHEERQWQYEDLRDILDKRVRADFARGRTERLRGWVLARTELAVYGLASLQSRTF